MNFNQTTVLAFFEPSKVSYEIPVYQRAYAWGENNWNEFLSDLYEQVDGENNYFSGIFFLNALKRTSYTKSLTASKGSLPLLYLFALYSMY